MTTEQFTSNQLVAAGWDRYSVITVSFADDGNAYNALPLLKELDSQQRVGIQEAVIVLRGEDGRVLEKDRIQSSFVPATAGGGLVGLLIGIIGGPFGMLIGGATGLLVGSLFDLADLDDNESALGQISSSVRVGRTALLAVVTEHSPDVIDAAMAGLGGAVSRRPVVVVEAEIAAAEKANRKAKWEARKELTRGRQAEGKAAISSKLEELKSKLHREENSPATSRDDKSAATTA